MKGADEYCRLFNKAEQHGRLYLLPHYHTRGKTFRIYVLLEGEAVIPNGGFNPWQLAKEQSAKAEYYHKRGLEWKRY